MKTFKEYRMPPITMGKDNTIVGVREDDVPEANNKTAFLQRVMPRFPGLDKKLGKDAWNRIVQVVKPKNQINSKRYVELGNIFDTGNFAKFSKALKNMEKKDGIK